MVRGGRRGEVETPGGGAAKIFRALTSLQTRAAVDRRRGGIVVCVSPCVLRERAGMCLPCARGCLGREGVSLAPEAGFLFCWNECSSWGARSSATHTSVSVGGRSAVKTRKHLAMQATRRALTRALRRPVPVAVRRRVTSARPVVEAASTTAAATGVRRRCFWGFAHSLAPTPPRRPSHALTRTHTHTLITGAQGWRDHGPKVKGPD